MQSFLTGARLDLSLTAIAVSFVYFILGLASVFSIQNRATKKTAKVYFGFLNFVFFALTIAEFPFYKEYNLRLNHLFFEYLGDPAELLLTVNAFFPLIYASIIFIAGGTAVFFLTSKIINKLDLFGRDNFLSKLISLLIIPVLTVIFIRGGLQRRPVNWGVAYFSTSNFLNQNSLNGIFNLFHDFRVYLKERKNKVEVKKYFTNKKAFEIVSEFNGYEKEAKSYSPNLKISRPNIVLIFMEGFDTTYIRSFGAQKSLAPNFDKLARKGILFTQFYSSGTRTSRGLVAGLCSYPITPGVNLTKKVQAQQFIPSAAHYLKDYKSLFFYGGDKDFEDMRAFFVKSGFDEFYDYKDYSTSKCPSKLGIFDEELFELTDKLLTRTSQPFFASILTLTNHEPFYLPKHFENKRPELTLAQRVFHYSDWALGKFIEDAKKKPYFKNTVFLITADHAKYSTKFDKTKFHIPLLIYSPSIENSRIIKKVTSQMNLPMTVMELSGFAGEISNTSFFEKSVFKSGGNAYVMLDPYFGVITENYFYRESLSGQFYLFDNTGNAVENSKTIKPLQDYARANLQLSQYLFLNLKVNTNQKQKKELFKTPGK